MNTPEDDLLRTESYSWRESTIRAAYDGILPRSTLKLELDRFRAIEAGFEQQLKTAAAARLQSDLTALQRRLTCVLAALATLSLCHSGLGGAHAEVGLLPAVGVVAGYAYAAMLGVRIARIWLRKQG